MSSKHSLGLWDPRRAGQTMPEPVINRAYTPGLAYPSGIPGRIIYGDLDGLGGVSTKKSGCGCRDNATLGEDSPPATSSSYSKTLFTKEYFIGLTVGVVGGILLGKYVFKSVQD
jgi:hypothetical protein